VSPNFFIFNLFIFSISGLVIGNNREFIRDGNRAIGNIIKFKYEKVSIIFGILSSLIILLPIIQRDHAILNAYNGNSLSSVEIALDKFPRSSIGYSRTIQILEKNGLGEASLRMAKKAEQFNPRSPTPYFIYLLSPLTTKEDKLLAYSKLVTLDPNNLELRSLKP